MLASSLFRRVLTPDEQHLIPESLISKLGEEMALHEEMAKGKVRELEKKIELCEEIIGDLNRKIVKQEVEMGNIRNSSEVVEKCNEMYSREIQSLKGEVAYYREKIAECGRMAGSFPGAEVYRPEQVDELLREKKDFENRMEDLKKKCSELEKSNRRLAEKVLDQKSQMSYLLKKISLSDGGRDSLELVKVVQKLSKKNGELERALGSGGYQAALLQSQSGENAEAEREEYKKVRDELYEVKRNGYALELEYNKVFREKSELCNQVARMSEEKKVMQKHIDEMKEEIICLKIDLKNTKTKNAILGDASQKLNEMNNEIVRSNFIIKDGRNKIRELKMQLAESEERYNKYILEDRTNVVAVIGREIEGIKRKLDADFKLICDIEGNFNRAIEEQGKLKSLFHACEQEILELRRENEALISSEKAMAGKIKSYEEKGVGYRSGMNEVGRDVRYIYEWIGEIINEFVELSGSVDRMVEFERERTVFIGRMQEEFNGAIGLLDEKDKVLRSLAENHSSEAIAFLEKERNILKQENIFLRNKMEGIGDSSDLLEKINSLEEENEGIKAQLLSLERAYASEKEIMSGQAAALSEADYRCRLLQSDVDQLLQNNLLLKGELESARKEIADNCAAIDKYRIVVEKLKKVKDAYLKLRNECLERKDKVEHGERDVYGTDGHQVSCGEALKVPRDGNATETEVEGPGNKEGDSVVKSVEARESPDPKLEVVSNQSPTPNEPDRTKNMQGRNRRGGRPGEEPKQGHQQRRAYGDRKRSWSSYEFKRNRDRRN
ncbi:hypothetical protein M970_060120 [Encephalitozoon cuniculi EcunIII-L]|uniref:Uncharacterized protein n=1 Tax=Encephalitozoon cuniculi TaxID=6035 RepID=M1JLZ6_ENCCN|nr:hypothetical protein ECU06_0180 [Encephalitozoon cuniculi]KMV65914.1 hypothetical protein M970_060120 [Encephalitozoon cuniculi EcunIII-L]